MTTNLWTVGQGLVTRRLMPKTPAPSLVEKKTLTYAAKRLDGDGRRQRRAAANPMRRSRRRAPVASSRRGRCARKKAADGGDRELTVEATGETVGEAKWAALRELERAYPGLDKSAVRFEVVSEGERGLLGVGYTPARVVAHLPAEAAEAVAFDESEPRDRRRDCLVRALLVADARRRRSPRRATRATSSSR